MPVKPLYYATSVIEKEEARMNLVIDVDEAIRHHNVPALLALLPQCQAVNYGMPLVQKINQELNSKG